MQTGVEDTFMNKRKRRGANKVAGKTSVVFSELFDLFIHISLDCLVWQFFCDRVQLI